MKSIMITVSLLIGSIAFASGSSTGTLRAAFKGSSTGTLRTVKGSSTGTLSAWGRSQESVRFIGQDSIGIHFEYAVMNADGKISVTEEVLSSGGGNDPAVMAAIHISVKSGNWVNLNQGSSKIVLTDI